MNDFELASASGRVMFCGLKLKMMTLQIRETKV